MEPRQPGNKKLPDFKELNDRIILEPSGSPQLVIETNLDVKNAEDENPYFGRNGEDEANTLLRDYFDE
ncbi:hypothetical protein [Peribacillus glennii]|uniref:Uncharacterized protein n=1 Tax=Peribacillus glennii TaxID=2303991 RepID=A0A372LHA7_9BACI|nr:hypothetical protein [Peribacillus glennii]RFU65332.1 hypothetical protein D0466_05385 [Peribacillus glennii]